MRYTVFAPSLTSTDFPRWMPASSAIEKRNRAVIAFILLTSVRDGAAASLKLKHVDLAEGKVVQDAREVRTKFSKTFTTWFFPGEEVGQEVCNWLTFLQRDMVCGPDEPLFPATEVVPGKDQQFEAAGLSRSHGSTASPMRKIFKEAFTKAGLSYFHPHSFCLTLAQLGERLHICCATTAPSFEPDLLAARKGGRGASRSKKPRTSSAGKLRAVGGSPLHMVGRTRQAKGADGPVWESWRR